MSDDLTKRLRWGCLIHPDGGRYPVNPDGPEAADEIERLREALTLILRSNSLAYAHEIAAKALEEKK